MPSPSRIECRLRLQSREPERTRAQKSLCRACRTRAMSRRTAPRTRTEMMCARGAAFAGREQGVRGADRARNTGQHRSHAVNNGHSKIVIYQERSALTREDARRSPRVRFPPQLHHARKYDLAGLSWGSNPNIEPSEPVESVQAWGSLRSSRDDVPMALGGIAPLNTLVQRAFPEVRASSTAEDVERARCADARSRSAGWPTLRDCRAPVSARCGRCCGVTG